MMKLKTDKGGKKAFSGTPETEKDRSLCTDNVQASIWKPCCIIYIKIPTITVLLPHLL